MRWTPSAGMVFQATFAVVAAILLAVCGAYATYTYQHWRAADRIRQTVDVSRDLFTAMQDVRHDRGVIAAALESGAPLSAHDRVGLPDVRARGARAFSRALARMDRLGSADGRNVAARLRAEQGRFLQAESAADRELAAGHRVDEAGARSWIAADDRFVGAMVAASGSLTDLVRRRTGFLGRMVGVGRLAWAARSTAGDTWLTLHRALVQARPMTLAESRTLSKLMGRVDGDWAMLQGLTGLTDTPAALRAAIGRADRLYFDVTRSRMAALQADLDANRPSAAAGAAWLAAGEPGLASLTRVGIVALDQASLGAGSQARAAERRFFLALAVMILVAGCCWAASVVMIRRYVRPMTQVTEAMRRLAGGDLSAEIPCLDRNDEIGALAGALGVFRENGLAKARMERDLKRAEVDKEAAEEASRLKSQFLANMSHEIRTPLNGVLGMVHVMQREEASPSQLQRLQIIRDSGETLLQILNDVLDFSKIEAGKLELHPEPFDLGELVRRTCAVFADIAAAKGLELRSRLAPEAEGVWRGDAARLRQMLMNLLSNAVKFTGSGSVSVSVGRPGPCIEIVVSDTGCGIDAEHLPRLFSKFSQADGSTTRRFGGTGLGLAICRELSAMMGGDIQVESVRDRGSTFTLRLPLERSADLGAPPASGPPAPPDLFRPADASPVRILAAEDNPINQKVLAALIEPLGAELHLVGSGREAIEAWRTGDFDLILMDIQMPGMSGVEATREIRTAEAAEARERTPIVAVSASTMQHQMDEYRTAGMELHVAKPIQASVLYAAVKAALDLREADPAVALTG